MRVAQLMAGAPVGGAELFFERLCLALHRAGETVLPAIRRDAGRAARLAAGGLAPVELGFGGVLDWHTRPRLRRALQKFAPGVVVAWMRRAAGLAPRGAWTLVGRLGGYYDLTAFRGCDHLVGNTAGISAWIEAQGWPASLVHHVPNFSPDFFGCAAVSRATLGVPEGKKLALALGRLHANKGFDVLVRALPRLTAVHAVIAGEGPERAALTALAAREGVAERVHFPGWSSDQGGLLAAADLLVCPSRHEPLGNVVLEAWSAARPVVAASVAGPAELIRDGADGLLVAPEDDAALAEAMGKILEDEVLADRLAAAGRARFVAGYAEAPVVEAWRRFLAGVAR